MSDEPEPAATTEERSASEVAPPSPPARPSGPAKPLFGPRPWHARTGVRWLLASLALLAGAVVALGYVERDEMVQLDYPWARPLVWVLLGLTGLHAFVAALVTIGQRARRIVWYVLDAALLAATAALSYLVAIPAADATPELRAVLLAAARIGITFAFATRVVARFAPGILDSSERLGFRTLVAVRHLRAKKSGFLTAIATLSILGVALSSCALTTTIGVMSGFGDDLKQKILGNHAHVVVDRGEGIFEDWRPVLERVRRAPGVVAATPYVASEVMLSSATNLSGVMLRGIDPASIGRVTDLSRNMKAGRLRYLHEPERLLDLPPDEARGILQPLTAPRRRRTDDGSGEPRNSIFDTDFRRDRPIPPPAWAVDGGAPLADTGPLDAGPARTADEAAERAAAAVAELLDQPLPERVARDDRRPGRGHDEPGDDDGDDRPDAGAAARNDEDDEDDEGSLFPEPDEVELAGRSGTSNRGRARDDGIEVLPGIVIGAELARNLRLFVGDEVNVVSPHGALGPAGPMPKSRPFRVAGIFYSGMYEYDAKYAYVLLPVAQRFLNVGEGIHGVEARVVEPERAPVVSAAIRAAIGRRDLRVRDWQEMNRNLFSALQLERLAMFIVLGIAILVASFCIVCTLLLMVLEKGREIAILKTMGAGDEEIRRVFMIEGVLIGMAGAALGLALGYTMSFSAKHLGIKLDPEVYYIDRLPVHIDLSDYGLVAIAALAVCFLSTLYPAHAASKLRPVDALRYE